ncbi:MAG: hypothetical protein A3K11_07300 [Nitrospirae bacterium RIFCSPLOWO2_12_FULL_63_8]|nr:MAG: hypothetical protein A3K11_07300 [Nitrospirae bacterium RIFCSPLOWO2_12_FULL_63_8]
MVTYVLAAIAGIWMADGLALLVAPRHVMARVREAVALAPSLLRWEGAAACLGVVLLLGTEGIHYQPLWMAAGAAMVLKGLFLAVGPEPWRHWLVDWCLRREDVDYRFWGVGLCTLAVLLLHALGWIGNR